MKVEVFSIMKNEEELLPFYLKHYQNKFKDCIINVYDNGSTDNSIQICKEAGCNIGIFPLYTEELLKDWKNNIWKNSDADWIIVCDIDELLDMSMSDLLSLEESVNVIKTQGYNMIDITLDDLPIEELTYGSPSDGYSKSVMFKNKSISEINYTAGSHTANPLPDPVYSDHVYKLLHYKKQNFSLKNLKKAHENHQYDTKTLDSTLEIIYNDYLLPHAVKIL
jgi:glycosyltransferase involved in cell wall biosynthesis